MALQPPDHRGAPDVDAVRLLRRLLVQRYGPGAHQEPALLSGQLPDGLRVALPLPEGSQVLGSVVHADQIEVVLEVLLDPEAALAWYRERLEGTGWREADQNPHAEGGFTHGGQADRLFFCVGDAGPQLMVRARATPGGPADLRLELRAEAYLCDPQRRNADPPQLPMIGPPPQGRHQWSGHSTGGDGVESHTRLVSALKMDAVARHYSVALLRAGWQPIEGGRDGALAWGIWSFADRYELPCRGTLLATRHPLAPDTYLLDLHAVRLANAPLPSLFLPEHSTPSAVSETPDPAGFLRLAQRLLTSAVAYDEAPEGVQLYPGTLPPGLVDLSLPEDGRVVGGMTSPLHAIGLLETATSVEDTLDFYRATLAALGWIAYDPSPGYRGEEGGFASVWSSTRLTYDRNERSELVVEAYELPGGGTDIRLDLQAMGATRRHPRRSAVVSGSALIPYLLPPESGEQHVGGSGSGPTSAQYSATLQTGLDLGAVLDHYARQMEQHGWIQTAAGQDGALGWRTWSRPFAGQEWEMLFYALRKPEKASSYVLQLEGSAR